MGEFPSGQRGQTVNLLALPSVVRIHLRPFTYLLRATVLARMRLISAIGMYEKRICRSGGTGRRPGLKIPWVVIPVPVRFRSTAAFGTEPDWFCSFFVNSVANFVSSCHNNCKRSRLPAKPESASFICSFISFYASAAFSSCFFFPCLFFSLFYKTRWKHRIKIFRMGSKDRTAVCRHSYFQNTVFYMVE